jgi:hypothetical protein
MVGGSFAKTPNASGLSAGNLISMQEGTTFGGDVNLVSAKIGHELNMEGASFAKTLDANSLSVGHVVNMNGATFNRNLGLVAARTNYLLLNKATVAQVDLTGAVVSEELNIAGMQWLCIADKGTSGDGKDASKLRSTPLRWALGGASSQRTNCDDQAPTPVIMLRNAHINVLQDSVDAWPPLMDLEGFRYERLGGLAGVGPDDLRARSWQQWTDWLGRDSTFSTQPYLQLASVLLAAGHRDTAERIQYAGRDRERHEDWRLGQEAKRQHQLWSQWSRWTQWAWLTALCFVAGYGIGLYTFRVLWWGLVLTVVGALVLWFSPAARRRGLLWRLGASLHRLLPGIELSKEFDDFFANPAPLHPYEPRNLNRFQAAFFAGLTLVGWILGFFLIAAITGLIPKS